MLAAASDAPRHLLADVPAASCTDDEQSQAHQEHDALEHARLEAEAGISARGGVDSPHGKPHGKDQEMVGDRAEEDLIALSLHPD